MISRRLLLVASVLAAHSALAANGIDVGDRRQLFLDTKFFDSSRGITLTVHAPQKTGAPVLVAEEPRYTSISGYGTVLHVDGIYQMWYVAATAIGGELGKNAPNTPDADYPVRLALCYARSTDGIHWEKPRLGLAKDFPHGEPNVIIGNGAGGFPEDGVAGPVTINPHPGADDRFLMPVIIQVRAEDRLQLDLFASGDGIHWHRAAQNIMTHRPGQDQLDTNNVVFWDDRVGKWVAYVRRNLYFPWGRSRATARAESDDVTHFPLVEDLPVVFQWDEHDPAVPGGQGDDRVRLVDYYTNVATKYPWAENAYLQFPSAFFHYTTGYEPEFPQHAPKNHGPVDIRFAASRDGIHWERYDRRAFVPLGPRGAWDGRTLYMVHGILPGATEDEIYLYYRGSDALHGWTRSRADVEQITAVGLAPHQTLAGIARLVLRRDGFVSARGDYEGGEFTTPPLRFTGDELVLNIDTSAGGEASVELLDETGVPLPGFALADADRIHTANEINHRVSWRGNASLAALAGKTIRVRILLRDADLYAFQFRSSPKP